MKQGDILLIKYKYDPIGWIIRKFTKSKWNHIAWALNNSYIIEANGSGIIISSIRKFQNKKLYDIKLIRIKNISKFNIQKVTKDLVSQTKRWRYATFLYSYILTILGSKKCPCKSCSWFITEALNKINYTISKKNIKYITPEDYNKFKYCIEVTDELQRGVMDNYKR